MSLAFPKPSRLERKKKAHVSTDGLALPKPHTARDARYREYVRSHSCAIKGSQKHKCLMPIDAAHFGSTGVGIKASDYAEIPLCRAAHMTQHAIGWATFEQRFGINRFEIAFALLESYVTRFASTERKGKR